MNRADCTMLVAFAALASLMLAAQAAPSAPAEFNEPGLVDYSRFYGMHQKKSSGFQGLNNGQWGLPRQLAPKFKRFNNYLTNDKRLDGDAYNSFYMQPMGQLSPGRLEWNFNRL